uniref:F-box associated beta-propeller type 1 domain-containing protein n=1 Tax=Solanum lycopersicum TaxID=4081 RepID=A0A3Q7GHP8_SOLLC
MYICRFRPSNIDEPIEWEDVSSLAPSSYARKKNVFMKGAIHWVAYKKEDETHQRNSVLFYNVKTEDFSEMNFPSSIEVTVASNYLLGGEEFKVDISTTDQSIQLVVGSFLHDTGFDIWIMNKYGNPISWSKRSHISPFTIPRNTDYRLNECLPEQTWMDRLSNRQIDFDDKLDEPLGIRNGEAVWWKTKKGFLALHDAATRNIRYAPNIRHTQVEGLQLFPDPMFVAKYKESLVLLPEVHFQISTNPLSRPLPPLLDGLPTGTWCSQCATSVCKQLYAIIKYSSPCSIWSVIPTGTAAVQKEISVLNQHNEKLVGVLHDTRSREIVVLCHGFKSSKDRGFFVVVVVVRFLDVNI